MAALHECLAEVLGHADVVRFVAACFGELCSPGVLLELAFALPRPELGLLRRVGDLLYPLPQVHVEILRQSPAHAKLLLEVIGFGV